LANPSPNLLIVEGHDDLHSVVGLMQHHLHWPDGKANAPVLIELGLSATEILNEKYLSTQIKRAGLRRLGVMFDADTNPTGRYESLRNLLLPQFPSLPTNLSADGICVEHGGMRFGVWLMPDNVSQGYLEDFLKDLVPSDAKAVWDYASNAVVEAKKLGAACKDVHDPKARLYTWLAWQDEPGQSPGLALKKKILSANESSAEPFIKWFCSLYELPRITE
jgi:hypothetical protein